MWRVSIALTPSIWSDPDPGAHPQGRAPGHFADETDPFMTTTVSRSGPASQILFDQRSAFVATAWLSGAINLLGLTSPLFMLQVYDRVLASGSLATLVALLLLAAALYAAQSGLERLRTRIFARLGLLVDRPLGRLAFETGLLTPRGGRGVSARSHDVDKLRGFLSGGGPAALFDLPWTPLYLILLFLLHPLLGLIGLGGAAALAIVTWATDRATGPLQMQHSALSLQVQATVDNASAARDTARAMGMVADLRRRWEMVSTAANAAQLRNADAIANYSTISKFIRLLLQSLVLAGGAMLIIRGDATGGVMIASSILLGKTLSPVDQAIAHWRGWVGARQAVGRLDDMPMMTDRVSGSILLPPPKRDLVVTSLASAPDGSEEAIIEGVSFKLEAGDILGIVGPSGAGKSTLLRTLAGLSEPIEGEVRLDGATLDQWPAERRGAFVGYMSQSIDLLAGSIAENIARFAPEPDSHAVLLAAEAAGLDTLIRGLEDGFDTQVGDHGYRLSVGQRQRVALARALYGDPFVLILDEPNSALDRDGDAALAEAVAGARARGAIVVVAAHRAGVLSQCTKMLALGGGRQQTFGAPGRVLAAITAEPLLPRSDAR